MIIEGLNLGEINPEKITSAMLVAYLLSKGEELFKDGTTNWEDVQNSLKEHFEIDIIGVKDLYLELKKKNDEDKEFATILYTAITLARLNDTESYTRLQDAKRAVKDELCNIVDKFKDEAATVNEGVKLQYNRVKEFIDRKAGE